jgi:hypothetical protein
LAEFKLGKIVQVSLIVLMAILISNVLAFTLWPSSAVNDLRQLMIECTDSFSESLGGITHNFLAGSDDFGSPKFATIETSHRTVFSSLLKSLQDAKYEHYVRGTEKVYHQESLLVESMQRLAQNIGGLRSAALTQYSLMREVAKHEVLGPTRIVAHGETEENVATHQIFTPPDHQNEETNWLSTPASGLISPQGELEEETSSPFPSSPLAVFEEFIFHLGPPMVSHLA